METATSHRPWEAERSNMHNKGPQTLPSISTLTANISNRPSETSPLSMSAVSRDSGNWPTPQSTMPNSSTYSGSAGPFNSSPNRFSGNQYSVDAAAPPLSSPTYTSTMANGPLPSLNQTFDPTNPRHSAVEYEESRRGSIDSRMNQGMDRLALNATSPYTSANASQTSLVSGLQKERGIQTNGSYRGPRYSASGPLSPLGPRTSRTGFTAGRVAPPIMENPRSEIYAAPAPTAGQPYAFPDPDLASKPERPGSTYSRRNSYADSFTSSIFTQDSRLPPGQQELPNANTHHHSLQNKQIQNVMDEGDSPNSNTPYSRTPELRVTHKLAERKRRSEMKGCFEALRQRLPANQTNKSSKWETLSRAIDYINMLENQNGKYRSDIDKLNQQHQEMDMRMKEMMAQLQKIQQGGANSYNEAPPNVISPMFANHNQFGNGTEPPRTLPPLMNGVAMQGVQYGDDRR